MNATEGREAPQFAFLVTGEGRAPGVGEWRESVAPNASSTGPMEPIGQAAGMGGVGRLINAHSDQVSPSRLR